jgi:hypothetical protein
MQDNLSLTRLVMMRGDCSGDRGMKQGESGSRRKATNSDPPNPPKAAATFKFMIYTTSEPVC